MASCWRLRLRLALGGCSTVLDMSLRRRVRRTLCRLAANIASLTEVVTSHPNDPQAYNMRGAVFGQGGSTTRR